MEKCCEKELKVIKIEVGTIKFLKTNVNVFILNFLFIDYLIKLYYNKVDNEGRSAEAAI